MPTVLLMAMVATILLGGDGSDGDSPPDDRPLDGGDSILEGDEGDGAVDGGDSPPDDRGGGSGSPEGVGEGDSPSDGDGGDGPPDGGDGGSPLDGDGNGGDNNPDGDEGDGVCPGDNGDSPPDDRGSPEGDGGGDSPSDGDGGDGLPDGGDGGSHLDGDGNGGDRLPDGYGGDSTPEGEEGDGACPLNGDGGDNPPGGDEGEGDGLPDSDDGDGPSDGGSGDGHTDNIDGGSSPGGGGDDDPPDVDCGNSTSPPGSYGGDSPPDDDGGHSSPGDGLYDGGDIPPDGDGDDNPPGNGPHDGDGGNAPPGSDDGDSPSDGDSGDNPSDDGNGDSPLDGGGGISSTDDVVGDNSYDDRDGDSPNNGGNGDSPPDGGNGEADEGTLMAAVLLMATVLPMAMVMAATMMMMMMMIIIRRYVTPAVFRYCGERQVGVGAASSVSGLPNHEMVCSRLPQGFELMCELCDFLRIVLLVKRVGKPIRLVGVESHYCSNDGAVRHRESCLNKLLVRFEVEVCSALSLPTAGGRLEKEGPEVEHGVPFRKAAGKMLWASIVARLCLLHAVMRVTQYISCFEDDCSLTASVVKHSCADRAEDPYCWSCVGNVSFVWGGVMEWASKKDCSMCVSTHKRELVEASQAAVTVKWQVVEDGLFEVVRVDFADYLDDFLTKPLELQKFVPKRWVLQMDRKSGFSSSCSVGVEDDK